MKDPRLEELGLTAPTHHHDLGVERDMSYNDGIDKMIKNTRNAIETFQLMHSYFDDIKKTFAWFNTKNNNLGGASPQKLIDAGRAHKVLAFVKSELSENDLKGKGK